MVRLHDVVVFNVDHRLYASIYQEVPTSFMYCLDTVDGRNPAPPGMSKPLHNGEKLSINCWTPDFWTINSMPPRQHFMTSFVSHVTQGPLSLGWSCHTRCEPCRGHHGKHEILIYNVYTPRNLTPNICSPKRGHFKRKGSSSNHVFFPGTFLRFQGSSLHSGSPKGNSME